MAARTAFTSSAGAERRKIPSDPNPSASGRDLSSDHSSTSTDGARSSSSTSSGSASSTANSLPLPQTAVRDTSARGRPKRSAVSKTHSPRSIRTKRVHSSILVPSLERSSKQRYPLRSTPTTTVSYAISASLMRTETLRIV